MTTLLRSQTFAFLPNSRLNTPIVPGPQTSWVISTSAWTHTLSPASTRDLPAARARIFSVSVIALLRVTDHHSDFNRQRTTKNYYIDIDKISSFCLIFRAIPPQCNA